MAEGLSGGFTFPQYLAACFSAASLGDEGRMEKIKRGVNVREVNRHDFDLDTDPPSSLTINRHQLEDSDDDEEGIFKEFLAYKASMKGNRPTGSRMDRKTWMSLDKEAQTAWDTIADEDKAKILTFASKNKDTTKKSIGVHMTETDMTDATKGDETIDDGPKLEVNSTDTICKAKEDAHPGDPRVLMSQQKSTNKPSKSPSAKREIKYNHVSFSTDDDDSSLDLEECQEYWDEVLGTQDFHKGD